MFIWYANKDYKEKLHQDLSVRSYVNKSFKHEAIILPNNQKLIRTWKGC